MKKKSLITYLLVACIGANILLSPLSAPQSEFHDSVAPHNDFMCEENR